MATTVLHARVPADHLAQLQAHAAANDRTLSHEVRRMVRLYCAMLERGARTSVHELSSSAAGEPMGEHEQPPALPT